MAHMHVEESARIDARPADIYNVLADYQEGHPQILPKQYFRDFAVESGGRGAGTVIRFLSQAGGVRRPYRMKVSEPEPGRVLAETDTASSLTTAFTVNPTAAPGQAQLTIAGDWDTRPGLAGLVERLLYPPTLRRIYRAELAQIAAYMHTHYSA